MSYSVKLSFLDMAHLLPYLKQPNGATFGEVVCNAFGAYEYRNLEKHGYVNGAEFFFENEEDCTKLMMLL